MLILESRTEEDDIEAASLFFGFRFFSTIESTFLSLITLDVESLAEAVVALFDFPNEFLTIVLVTLVKDSFG